MKTDNGCTLMSKALKETPLGFTLMEILIALGLTMAVGFILTLTFTQSNQIFSQQTSRINTGLDSNKISITLSEGVKTASGIVSQYPPTGTAQYSTGSETMVLSLPSISSNGMIIDNTSDYLIFTKDSQKPYLFKKLLFANPSSSRKNQDQILISSLSSVSFQYFNNSGLSVSPPQATNIKYVITNSQQSEQNSASGHLLLRND